jgi:hypothetical protein
MALCGCDLSLPKGRERCNSVGTVLTRYAFIYLGPGTDPAVDRVCIDRAGFRADIVAVPDRADALPVAIELVDAGVELLELCGAFDLTWAARVSDALGGRVPVGAVSFGPESAAGLAALEAQQ